jgi:hypothetical protein
VETARHRSFAGKRQKDGRDSESGDRKKKGDRAAKSDHDKWKQKKRSRSNLWREKERAGNVPRTSPVNLWHSFASAPVGSRRALFTLIESRVSAAFGRGGRAAFASKGNLRSNFVSSAISDFASQVPPGRGDRLASHSEPSPERVRARGFRSHSRVDLGGLFGLLRGAKKIVPLTRDVVAASSFVRRAILDFASQVTMPGRAEIRLAFVVRRAVFALGTLLI